MACSFLFQVEGGTNRVPIVTRSMLVTYYIGIIIAKEGVPPPTSLFLPFFHHLIVSSMKFTPTDDYSVPFHRELLSRFFP